MIPRCWHFVQKKISGIIIMLIYELMLMLQIALFVALVFISILAFYESIIFWRYARSYGLLLPA